MFKRLLLIISCIFLITGCTLFGSNVEKIKLDDIYYNDGEFVDIKSEYLDDSTHKNYVLFAYNNFCSLPIPCENVFRKYMNKYKIDFLYINVDEYKKTKLYKEVKYVPTVIVVSNGEVKAYLDAESDADIDKYQDLEKFEDWINTYIYTSK